MSIRRGGRPHQRPSAQLDDGASAPREPVGAPSGSGRDAVRRREKAWRVINEAVVLTKSMAPTRIISSTSVPGGFGHACWGGDAILTAVTREAWHPVFLLVCTALRLDSAGLVWALIRVVLPCWWATCCPDVASFLTLPLCMSAESSERVLRLPNSSAGGVTNSP